MRDGNSNPLKIARAEDLVAIQTDEWIDHGIKMQVVVVDFGCGAIACMKIGGGRIYAKDPDVRREKRV